MLCTYHDTLHWPPQFLARKPPFSRPQVERRPTAFTEINLFLNLHKPIRQYHHGLIPGNTQRGRSIQRRFQNYLLSLHIYLRGTVLYSGVSSLCIDTPLKHWVVQPSESGKQPNIMIKIRKRKGGRKPHKEHPPNMSSTPGPLSGQSAQHQQAVCRRSAPC